MCPQRMCASWMRAVSFDGMESVISAMDAIVAPPSPVNATVKAPARLALFKAAHTFLLEPEVEMPTSTSPLPHSASACRGKHARTRNHLRPRSGWKYPSSAQSRPGRIAPDGNGPSTQPPSAVNRRRCHHSRTRAPSFQPKQLVSFVRQCAQGANAVSAMSGRLKDDRRWLDQKSKMGQPQAAWGSPGVGRRAEPLLLPIVPISGVRSISIHNLGPGSVLYCLAKEVDRTGFGSVGHFSDSRRRWARRIE